MKNQALSSLKDKSKKLKCRLLQFLFGALRVKDISIILWWWYKPKVPVAYSGHPIYSVLKVYNSNCC